MLKKLDSAAIHHADHGGMETNTYFVELDPKYAFEDLFRSSFWDHHRAKFNKYDIVRARANNGDFDVMLTIAGISDSGIEVELWPKFPGHLAAAAVATATSVHEFADAHKPTKVALSPVDGKPLVRTEFLPATKWRVLGFDGREVKRDLKTQTEADAAMQGYLAYHKLTMPGEDEIAEAVKAIEEARLKRQAADKAKQAKVA